MARELAKKEGLLVGISAGGAVQVTGPSLTVPSLTVPSWAGGTGDDALVDFGDDQPVDECVRRGSATSTPPQALFLKLSSGQRPACAYLSCPLPSFFPLAECTNARGLTLSPCALKPCSVPFPVLLVLDLCFILTIAPGARSYPPPHPQTMRSGGRRRLRWSSASSPR